MSTSKRQQVTSCIASTAASALSIGTQCLCAQGPHLEASMHEVQHDMEGDTSCGTMVCGQRVGECSVWFLEYIKLATMFAKHPPNPQGPQKVFKKSERC
eukprot:6466694-Amphidinium_carterae.1